MCGRVSHIPMAHLIYRWLGILLVSIFLTGCGAPNYAPVRDAAPTAASSADHSPSPAPIYSPDHFSPPYSEPILVESVFTPADVNEMPAAPVENTIVEKPAEPAPAVAEPAPPPVAAPLTSPDAGKSKWIWPSSGKVIRGFSKQNKGLDIQGNRGDPVYAAAEGEVVYSGTGLRGYGQLVIIKHNPEYVSAYAHNSAVLVDEGEHIKQGQKIAEIGDSGTDSVKLYFELRYKGKPVDPIKYLPKR